MYNLLIHDFAFDNPKLNSHYNLLCSNSYTKHQPMTTSDHKDFKDKIIIVPTIKNRSSCTELFDLKTKTWTKNGK